MYGDDAMRESAHLKVQLDPAGQLGRGNLFDEDVLNRAVAEAAAKGDE